jgi:hypothetical protein
MRRGTPSSPSELFEAAVHPARESELAEEGLVVLARPGSVAPREVKPGALVVRRAHGEGRLTIVCAVTRVVHGRASMESLGVRCEGRGEGVFVEVSGESGRHALRVANPQRVMLDDTVLLAPKRLRRRAPGRVETIDAAPAEDIDASRVLLLSAIYALRRRSNRTVRDEYARSLLEPRTGASPLAADLQRAVADLDTRLSALPAGATRAQAQQSLLDEVARTLLSVLERHFILDEQRSTLELLEPAERDRYLGFAWHAADFPGGPAGPNEARADRMFTALAMMRPERRVNQGEHAAVRASEFDAAMQARVTAALVAVPGETTFRLHRDASAAYAQMSTAARAEGVTLAINNSYRPAAVAQANAARAGNRAAVASFSSHTLGLAIDLNMSHGRLRFAETSTRPFQNVVDMFKSPVHKWMFLRGERYGWFPYRREPWHWEYNPAGFRDRLRQPHTSATSPSDAPAPSAAVQEGITDPLTPPRAAIALSGSVGRGARNAATDVQAAQARLVELRVLEQNDATSERQASGNAAEASLPKTIEAIERFQRQMGTPVDGTVDVKGVTRIDLDRAIPPPTAAEFTAITSERNTIRETVKRGLTLREAVGSTGGNTPGDVRAVQQRLVDLGTLPAAHREAPATGATTPVPESSLRATIQGLRKTQKDVRFWVSRRSIAGPITDGRVTPGDATATFLDRVSVYAETIGATTVSFRDHVVSSATQSERGVMFLGTAEPSRIPLADYRTMGLSADQAAALKLVSTHEGNFDAINTYDRALVSVGFIQFAGSRGLPGYLALLKARLPAKFRDLLQKFGIDVEFTVSGTTISAARVVVIDPGSSSVLRAAAAETAIRDDKKLTAALIVAGRDRDVQLTQIEAAARDYVLPALNGTVSWASGQTARLGELLRSQKGMAALFDRSIQEGVAAARRRFERILRRLVPQATPPARPSKEEMQRREGDVLAELERDLQAAADVSARIARARSALQTVIRAATASGASLAGALAHADFATARRAVTDARAGLSSVVNVAPSPNVTVDATIASMAATLAAEEIRLTPTPVPSSVNAFASALTASRQALTTAAGPVATAPRFLARIQRIRRSTLDSGLTEVA